MANNKKIDTTKAKTKKEGATKRKPREVKAKSKEDDKGGKAVPARRGRPPKNKQIVVPKIENKLIRKEAYKSNGVRQIIAEFCDIQMIWKLNMVGKKFYEITVPMVMQNMKYLPRIDFFSTLLKTNFKGKVEDNKHMKLQIRTNPKNFRILLRKRFLSDRVFDKYVCSQDEAYRIDFSLSTVGKKRIIREDQGIKKIFEGTVLESQNNKPHCKQGSLKMYNSNYEGSFKEGLRHGFGVLIDSSRMVYYGQFKDDKACGIGLKIFRNNDVYFGEFKNGKKHGRGVSYQCVENSMQNREYNKWYSDKKDIYDDEP